MSDKDKKLNENLENNTTEQEASAIKSAEELGAMDVDELMEQYDLETSKLRKLTGKVALFITIVAILMSAFHLFTAW
ncbi:MAG: C4-dicarboxylate ABC transporter permease, partial [Peptoniphilus harei]|nr:C4-dicarboxylate ABC transporter permease [Peptoniphilus harei]